jgi:ABC-type sulfate transport system substrate-binding protein
MNIFALTLVVLALGSIAAKNIHGSAPVQLLNASYDPTRELYAALNPHFADVYAKTRHSTLAIEQSHGGSSRQARAVIDGKLAADVVTFGLENEALRETAESKGELEIVYPTRSILAEPAVAWVDVNIQKHGTHDVARAYLEFLFTDKAQELNAQNGYRPFNEKVLARHAQTFPTLDLFRVTAIAKDWEDAQQQFFSDNGIIDTVYKPKPR